MNCQSCLNESETYRVKKISADKKSQVEKHIETCTDCANIYRIDSIIDIVIKREKEIISNPFLATRIIACLETGDNSTVARKSLFSKVLRPALIIGSMAASIFLGVITGNIYPNKTRPLPLEITLADDFTIESIDILSID